MKKKTVKKALVTGSTGLVGANVVRALLREGQPVRAMVRPTSDLRALAGLDVEQREGDVLDLASLTAAAEGCDVLYHVASIFSYWGTSAAELHETAVMGALNAVEAAHAAGVRRMVLTSSSVTLGSSNQTVPLDETSQSDDPNAPDYYRSKIDQERATMARARELGVDLVVVCPGIVVGPYDYRLSPSNGILLAYWDDVLATTWPGGINLVYADDVAKGHLLAAKKGNNGERYFLGSENLEWSLVHRIIAELSGLSPPRVMANHTTCYLAAAAMEATARFTGKPPRTTREQARQVGRFYWYTHEKAAKLGYSPRPARQALAETIAWMLVQSPHVSRALRARLSPSREVMRAREQFLGEKEVSR